MHQIWKWFKVGFGFALGVSFGTWVYRLIAWVVEVFRILSDRGQNWIQ